MEKGQAMKSVFKSDPDKKRIAALFDGVFAVAMTILVLELKLPRLQDGDSIGELWAALRNHGSTFFSYLLSFFILGSLWIVHSRIFGKLLRISGAALAVHMALLITAAFFPSAFICTEATPGTRWGIDLFRNNHSPLRGNAGPGCRRRPRASL
jgi:Predicted integral membrane protein